MTAQPLPESDLPIPKLELSLSARYLTNSYKLYWFLGMLDIIKEFPDESSINIDFNDVVYRMIALSWYTLLEYKLNFGAADQLSKTVHFIEKNTILTRFSNKNEIIDLLKNTEDVEIKNMITDFTNYVPYRFLTTFIDGLQSLPDHKRNSAIEAASKQTQDAPYAITGNTCIMDLRWLEYFYLNMPILKGWAEMRLTSFLQKRNPNVPAIHQKLRAPFKRDLSKARKYWIDFISNNTNRDIFSGGELFPDGLSIDHFVPWSFVLHDRLWNLVPTTREINSSKNDRLPVWDRFFPVFAGMQFAGYKWHVQHDSKNKLLEDYLLINPDGFNSEVSENTFRNALEDTLYPAYRIAKNQGFGLWEYQG